MSLSYSIKGVFKFCMALIIIAMLMTGFASSFFLSRAIDINDTVIDDSMEEIRLSMGLQLAIEQSAMPPNDHIIHSNHEEQHNYQTLTMHVETRLDELMFIKSLSPQKRAIIKGIHAKWQEARLAGDAIMSLPDPASDPRAAGMMEAFDSQIANLVSQLKVFNKLTREEVEHHQDNMQAIWHISSLFTLATLLSGLVIAVIGGIALARIFTPSMKILNEHMSRYSKGELGCRIHEDMPGEFHELRDGFNVMADKLEHVYKTLSYESAHDHMTGCYNHRKFIEDIHFEVARCLRHHRPLSLLMIDVDHFKAINDNYGHPVGDKALRALANKINNLLRETDTLYRYGGEEFSMLLAETDLDESKVVAERLRQAVESMVVKVSRDTSLSFTISIGIAALHTDATDELKLIKTADESMYWAKTHGRNCVCYKKNKCLTDATEESANKKIS